MKLEQHKRMLTFLEILMERLERDEEKTLTPKLLGLYDDNELTEIVLWLYTKTWTKESLSNKPRAELEKLIGGNKEILLWTIDNIEKGMKSFLNYSQEEADSFFARVQMEHHYLNSKPVDIWDGYDRSNYRSLLMKRGKAKKVYAIFTSDVLSEDAHAVTTKSSYFFDTEKEAEAEIQNIITEKRFTADDLVIHSLWLLT